MNDYDDKPSEVSNLNELVQDLNRLRRSACRWFEDATYESGGLVQIRAGAVDQLLAHIKSCATCSGFSKPLEILNAQVARDRGKDLGL